MRVLILVFLLAGSARAQQLLSTSENPPREAESILISSCRIVGERLAIPMPNPRVELRLGEKTNSVDSKEGLHVIHLKRWNKHLFKQAAMRACYRFAEPELIFSLEGKVPDY